jgi:hypothetical protein
MIFPCSSSCRHLDCLGEIPFDFANSTCRYSQIHPFFYDDHVHHYFSSNEIQSVSPFEVMMINFDVDNASTEKKKIFVSEDDDDGDVLVEEKAKDSITAITFPSPPPCELIYLPRRSAVKALKSINKFNFDQEAAQELECRKPAEKHSLVQAAKRYISKQGRKMPKISGYELFCRVFRRVNATSKMGEKEMRRAWKALSRKESANFNNLLKIETK